MTKDQSLDTTMYEHDELKSAVEQRLQDFSASSDSEWYINTEEHIEPPVVPPSRRIDIAVRTDQDDQQGYGLEIKTPSSQRYLVSPQLRDYLLAGFQPILVAPVGFPKKPLPSSPGVNISQIIQFLDATFVAVTETDPFALELREDRLPVDDNLRPFFVTSS